LNDRGIGFRRKAQPDGKGRTVWVFPACRFNPGHGDPDSCIMQAPDGEMSAHCFHASCKDKGWQEFKHAIGPPEAHHYDPPLSGAKGGKGGQAHQGVALGPLLLVVDRARQTPSGRLTIVLRVLRAGQAVDLMNVFGTATGRRAAAKHLQGLAGEVSPDAVAAALSGVFVEAARQLDAAPAPAAGSPLRQAVRTFVQENFGPTKRVGRRVFLAAFNQDYDRPAFLQLLGDDMLDAVRQAAHIPAGTSDYDLMALVDAEMRLLFGHLVTTLPQERKSLAACVVGMWSAVKCLSKVRATDGTERTHNTSLIGLAREWLTKHQEVADRSVGGWVQLHPGHPAFVRRYPVTGPDGEVRQQTLLAMNSELSTSSGVRLPDGVNIFNLKKLGKRDGIFRDVPGVSGHAEHGRTRVIALSAKLTRFLLENVCQDRTGGGNASSDDGGGYGDEPFGTGEQG
jgi:hypothetical protein